MNDSVQQQRTGSLSLEEEERMKRLHQHQDVVLEQTAVLSADVQQLVIKEEVPHEWSSSLDRQDTETLHIKEEQEELWTSQEVEQLNGQEETDVSRFQFTAVPVKSEDDEEKPQFSQLHLSQNEDDREETSSSAKQMKTESDVEDCGGPKPTENLDPNSNLLPNTDGKSSDSPESNAINGDDGEDDDDKEELQDDEWQEPLSDSGSETEDSDRDWKETRAPSNVGCNTDKKLFSCSECDKQFLHKRSLQRHMACHSGKKSSSCSTNKKTCGVKQNVDSQTRSHKGERPFDCDVCGKSFTRQCNLNRHKKVHTGEKPFGCDVCTKKFSRPEELKTHTRVHTGEKPFGCDVCGKRFNQKIHIKRHMRVHTGEKPFGCDVCGKRFMWKVYYETHMRVHTEEDSFGCDVCGKRFSREVDLKIHTRVHTGEKPFKCATCGKTFMWETSFKTHMRMHTGEKPFTCNVCGKRFSQKVHFKTHTRVHTGEKPFNCSVCGKRFMGKTSFKTHMRIHTGEKPFDCGVCGKRFNQKIHLKKHMKVHAEERPFGCDVCGQRFNRKAHLETHTFVHSGEKPFGCDLCGNKFTRLESLKRHMSAHTGEKPVDCCERVPSEENLKRHVGAVVLSLSIPRLKLDEKLETEPLVAHHPQNDVINQTAVQYEEGTSTKVPDRKEVSPSLEELFGSDGQDSYAREWVVSLEHLEDRDQMDALWKEEDEGRVIDDYYIDEITEDEGRYDKRDANDVPEDDGDDEFDLYDTSTGANLNLPEEPPAESQQISKTPQMGKPCGIMCRQKCSEKISEDRRRQIFDAYQTMSYSEKKRFILHMISQCEKKRLTLPGASRRMRSLTYHLTDNLGQPQKVCKTLFLSTLGYHPKNDKLIVTVLRNTTSTSLIPPQDRRGRHAPGNKIEMSPIYEHIESFNPTVNHYRHEHAPNRRYLPSDVNIQMMYHDYKASNAPKCSYETYRKAVKEKNISFTKSGQDECEICLKRDIHMRAEHREETNKSATNICTQEGDQTPFCLTCQKWEEHKRRAERGRHHYKLDAEKKQPDDLSIRSVDVQKIIMLPRMPGVKITVFTKRISAFHETFATVGKKSKRKSISIIWHEGIAGRKAEEVASAYVIALQQERDIKHVIYWVDNCTAQNKNWCLLSALVAVVNDPTSALEDVTLKYFEPGHTFMSADSFHHGVEKEMKKQPAVLDFGDFSRVIASSNSGKVDVIELKSENILAWKAGHSLAKLKKAPNLSDVAVVQLRRGSRDMFFKLSHDQEEFTQVEFLMKEATLEFPAQLRPGNKGIERQKKSDIISKLCPLMPPNRRHFWENLSEEE